MNHKYFFWLLSEFNFLKFISCNVNVRSWKVSSFCWNSHFCLHLVCFALIRSRKTLNTHQFCLLYFLSFFLCKLPNYLRSTLLIFLDLFIVQSRVINSPFSNHILIFVFNFPGVRIGRGVELFHDQIDRCRHSLVCAFGSIIGTFPFILLSIHCLIVYP